MKGVMAILIALAMLLALAALFPEADPFTLVMLAPVVSTADRLDNHGIKRACAELLKVIKVLDKPNPTKVIQQLPENTEKTLKVLVEDTGIPQSTLHHVLNVLWDNGLIYKTVERPAKFGRTEFLGYVLSIGAQIERRKVGTPYTTEDTAINKEMIGVEG